VFAANVGHLPINKSMHDFIANRVEDSRGMCGGGGDDALLLPV
jgi:hypothetical protein